MIKLKANGRCAACVSDEVITSGSNGIEVVFELSEDFDDLAALAVFRGSGEEIPVILLQDRCTVPPGVLTEAGGKLLIGVYARDAEGNIAIPTVWAVAGPILRGTTPDLPDEPPTPDWTAQVELALQEAVDALNAETGKAAESAVSAAGAAALAESWAVGRTGARAGEEYDNAKFWAMVAQQGAKTTGYVIFDVHDDDGHMYVTITEDLSEDLTFAVNEQTGRLEVTYHE